MCRKICLIILLVAGMGYVAGAQELQARISINSSRVSSQVNKNVFQTLQGALNNFLNNRKWTKESFQPNEKIVCNFLLNISEAVNTNTFKATLTIQAARPVYNTAYETPLINFMDEDLVFKYVEYQQIDFNENRVSGTDALSSNLSAVLAYYVYLILGLDFDSFSLRGGDQYFQKAMTIVNNAPESRDIAGWKAFDGLRNRYWLIENLTNNRYNIIHDAIYNYYRMGMDYMNDKEKEARTAILNAISMLYTLNNDVPGTMIVSFFFQGKVNELTSIFKKATPQDMQRAREMLVKLDITNANRYKQELK